MFLSRHSNLLPRTELPRKLLSTSRGSESIRKHIDDLGILLEKAKLIAPKDGLDDSDEDLESDSSDTDYGSSDESTPNFCRDISSYTRCLMDLSPTIERTSLYARYAIEVEKYTPAISFQVSGPALAFVRYVHDKFREADTKLVERLGEANWQRSMRIRKLMEMPKHNEMIIRPEPPIAQSVFRPVSKFHDSGLGSSVLAQSTYAASAASHTSFVSSLAEASKGRLRVPPTPAEVALGKPFECSICGSKLSKIKNRVEWKYGSTLLLIANSSH